MMTRSEFDKKVVEGLNAKLDLEKVPKSLQNMLSGYQFSNAITATKGGVDVKTYLEHPYKYQDRSDIHFKAYEKDGDERHIASAVRAVKNAEQSRWLATTIECRYISAMTGESFGGKNYSVEELNKNIRDNADKLFSCKSWEEAKHFLVTHMNMVVARRDEIALTKQLEQNAKSMEWKASFKLTGVTLDKQKPADFSRLAPEEQKKLADEIRDVRYAYVGGGKEIYEPSVSVKLDGKSVDFYDLSRETRNLICDQLAAGHDRGTASLHEVLKREDSQERKVSGKARDKIDDLLGKHMDKVVARRNEIVSAKRLEQNAKFVEWNFAFVPDHPFPQPPNYMMEKPADFSKFDPVVQKGIADALRCECYGNIDILVVEVPAELQNKLSKELKDPVYGYITHGKGYYNTFISLKLDGKSVDFYDLSRETRNLICDQLAAGRDRGTASLHEDLKQEDLQERKVSLSDVKAIAASKREKQDGERKHERSHSVTM